MKLIIILSVVACSYAAKLDRAYLPPANAATAGGTPGALIAPGSGPNLPSGPSSFTQAFEQGPKSQSEALQSKPRFESASQYQPNASGSQFGQSGISSPQAEGPAFGQAPNSYSGNQGPFGNQGPQDVTTFSEQYQPERAQASVERNSETLRSESQNDGDNFAYSFETSNGITAEESGVATNGVQAQGGYSYTGDDGQQYRVTYTADENGYQPQGEHLPTPHPIPEEILRSLEENARAAAAGTQEGAYQPEEESNFGPQQYSNGVPSYQAQAQLPAQGPSTYNQGGQATNSQYNTPSASRFVSAQPSGSQGYQYQAGSNQALTQNEALAPGFSFPRGQAPVDQGPSPSTPTASNVFVPSESRQPTQSQSPFGRTSPAVSGPARQGQASGQAGYQYTRPENSSPFGRITQLGAIPSQQTEAQPSGPFKPQSLGTAYSAPQGFGPTNELARIKSNDQISANQVFGSAQNSNARGPTNGLTFGSSGPTSAGRDSTFSRLNGAQAYTLADPSASPSTPQGSAFRRPSTSSADNGYAYGPGISSGSDVTKSSGQGFTPSGPFGPARSSGSPHSTLSSGPIGQSSGSNAGFASQGSRPSGSSQSSQGSAFPRPNGSINGPTYATQGPFGGAPQNQPSSQAQGPAFSGSNGAFAPKAQGQFGAAPQYQPNQSSPSAQFSQGPAYSRPNGSAVGTSGSAPTPQGPRSSMPNQQTPYQYNKPRSQVSQSGSTQNFSGSQPGFRTPEGKPGQTFGERRQPPSFSPEEGYKY